MLIRFMNSDEPSWRGVLYAAAMFFASMGESLFNSQYEYRIFLVSMRMRSAMINAIYRKALTLSSASKGFFTTGEIVNLMSVDTQRIMEYIQVFNFLWSTPIQVVLATYLLWQQLGVATVGGLAVMIGLLPVNAFITGFLRKYQVSVMEQKDRRIKLMNEMLAGIKVLKLYAWETAFEKRVKDLRNKELRYLKIQAYLNAAVVFSFACAPFLVSLTSFGMYVLIDSRNILDANKAFVSLTLFNTLRVPLAFLPLIISNTAMFLVSVARINDFLRSDDLDPRAVLHGSEQDDKPVKFVNASFAWSRTGPATLHDITLSVPKGSLVAIVGSVGSGKSSLLSACLGDLVKLEGSVTVSGTVAYSPQQAWIQNNSVKNNILFGKSYDHDRYEQVIEACALKTDLAVLPAGDETEIGEKGINLSGGQKQRISIARAVYSDRDIYLFDDPLSAVDSNVGKHIFEKVIGPDGMLGGKTRVLVTHRLSVLPDVDTVVVLRDGTVSDVGTFQELVSRGGAFSDFLVQFIQESEGEGRVSEEDVKLFSELASRVSSPLSELTSYCSKFSGSDADDGSSGVEDGHKKGLRKRTMSKRSSIGGELDSCGNIRPMRRHLSKAQMASKAKLTEEETAQVGSVKWWVYWEFTKAMGIWITLGTLATYVISHAFNMGGSIWVSVFSKDIDAADVTLPFNGRMLLVQFLRTVVAFVLIAMETPIFLAAVAPIILIYYFVQKVYIATSRQLKRLESITRSPIYVHFSETVTGSSSIRAYGATDRFVALSDHLTDINHSTYFPSVVATRWLATRLEFLGYCIVFIAAFLAALGRGTLSPGMAGLSVSYALTVTMTLNMLVRSTSDTETNLVAVERCFEYARVPQEAPWENPDFKPDPSWPTAGKVVFEEYSTRYRSDLDLVLKEITCAFYPGEKVRGNCWKDGAGKSSLTLALFRIIEACNGAINIDGLDISTLGLYDLRSKLTIIPQDPVLFSGTLRSNLDPFDTKSDHDIWRALEQSHLKDFVTGVEKGLLHDIVEGGENISVGQRQLVCLARALLRKSRILILDEATAAVDMETDDLIQATIRREFSDCTIITIAHRLNTILDYDRWVLLFSRSTCFISADILDTKVFRSD
ncbi:hypothetical protein HPB48_001532 [Haemaphysalis longicornis]|uniref:Uncharacterized protein n=1 Tax=Haemaphysalis longicornis TaxID=44386 RepID=A0A9J6GQA7_HAELO|nr:hypothetical protein HPB48_001532 [Haemaphysalis longicornis]